MGRRGGRYTIDTIPSRPSQLLLTNASAKFRVTLSFQIVMWTAVQIVSTNDGLLPILLLAYCQVSL